MSAPTTALVDAETISVAEDFNPRNRFDERGLAELEASIRQSGVVTALTVSPNGDGGYVLIAGERRLIAARRAGVKQIPVVIREGEDALAAAVAENLLREDLDPIEEARALQRLAESEKLATHSKLAKRIGKSSAYVSERLRLLALPEAVQSRIAEGSVPVAAERKLRLAAEVDPAIAECACRLVGRGEIEGRDLIERFDEVLCAVAESDLRGRPTMIEMNRGVRLSEVIADPEEHAIQAERWRQALPYHSADDPIVRFEDADVDAARASGRLLCLEVDHGGWTSTLAYLCDAELAADLAGRVLKRSEKAAAKRAKDAERNGDEAAPGTEPNPEALKEQRREERREAKLDSEKARTFNLELGRKLLARRGAKSRKVHALDRARALAELILADNPNLAAHGLRLVLPQLQEVEVRQLKSGEQREIVTYRDPQECEKYLRRRIAEAKSAEQVHELLADALIAATEADRRELPLSKRVNYWVPAEQKVRKSLAADVKGLRLKQRSPR